MKVTVCAIVLVAIGYTVHSEKQRVKRGLSLNPTEWKPAKWLKSVGKSFDFLTIYPGTKWCGKGTKAKNDNDLGRLKKPDRCCRAHDKCKYSIGAKKTKYGIKNSGLITMSHCDCEKQFFNCLENAKTSDSNVIGVTYFDVLKLRCIYQGYPKKCKGKWIFKKCKTDKSKGKVWMHKSFGKSYFYTNLLQIVG